MDWLKANRPEESQRVVGVVEVGKAAYPDPSDKTGKLVLVARPTGTPHGPGHRYGVHFLWPGPGAPPSVPPHLKR